MGFKPRRTWSWELGDPAYPIMRVRGAEDAEIILALAHWWAKIAELAPRSDNWDVMVGDIWLDSGRIIGHVQMGNVAVGYDTGFRVAAQIKPIVDGLVHYNYKSSYWEAMKKLLIRCAESAVELEPARSALEALATKHPFEIAITDHGQWRE